MAGYHVRQRGKKGRWYAVIYLGTGPNGKKQYKWIALDPEISSKREAEREAKKLSVQRDQDMLPRDSRMTVAELMERWLEAAVADDRIEATTLAQYRSRINLHIVPNIGAMKIADVRGYHLKQLYQKLIRGSNTGRPLKPQTVGIIHAMLHQAFKYAVSCDLIPRNPVDGVTKPTGKPKEKVILESDQFHAFVRSLSGTRLAMPALLLVTTGLRRGELLALRWSHVDLDKRMIYVREQLARAGNTLIVKAPKRNRIRDIPLPSITVDALLVYREQQEQRRKEAGAGWVDRDLVIDNGVGDYWKPTSFTTAFTEAAKQWGVDLTPHSLRHAYASIVYDYTGDMKLIQELLGHADMSITENIYTHVFEKRKRQATKTFDSIFGSDHGSQDLAPDMPDHPVH